MIKQLIIKNFILIEDLTLNFSDGFNVLTGETGAGKSIIIKAIDVVFGAKTTKEMIKPEKDFASIELSVTYNNEKIDTILSENGIENFGGELILSKEITKTSARSRINGTLVTQDFIKNIREELIDIHSQHQTYVCLQPKQHINLLDNYCGKNHLELLKEYENVFAQYNEIKAKLELAQNSLEQNEQEIDFLKYQIKEIEDAQIEDIEEDKKLNEELELLSNAETIKELSFSSYQKLYGADVNILEALSDVKMSISKLSGYDEQIATYEEEIINAMETIRETASFLRDYGENVSTDEEKIDLIQERLGLFNKLKRKYGATLEDILNKKDSFCEKLSKIDFSQDDIDLLKKELEKKNTEVVELAQKISQTRKNEGEILSQKVTEELQKLELKKAQFVIMIDSCDKLTAKGADTVEFFITTNLEQELKPLAKTASGGEISRVMLALKTIFAQTDNIDTVIFDEVDTGISGSAAGAVADEMLELSKSHQVISITHLPIIAAKAEKNFYVKKSQVDSTKINVFDLDEENKIKALALMASGEINEESINFARGLVKNRS